MVGVGVPCEPLLLEPAAPQPNGRDTDAELVGDLHMGGTLGRPEDDPGTYHGALLGRARTVIARTAPASVSLTTNGGAT